MISGVKTVSSKGSADISPSRVIELRKKIHDKDYVNNAIQRIAFVLSGKLVEERGENSR